MSVTVITDEEEAPQAEAAEVAVALVAGAAAAEAQAAEETAQQAQEFAESAATATVLGLSELEMKLNALTTLVAELGGDVIEQGRVVDAIVVELLADQEAEAAAAVEQVEEAAADVAVIGDEPVAEEEASGSTDGSASEAEEGPAPEEPSREHRASPARHRRRFARGR